MEFLRIYNYDGKVEHIAVSEIESIVEPGPSMHDNGAVVLKRGRRIALGQSVGQAQELVKQLRAIGGARRPARHDQEDTSAD